MNNLKKKALPHDVFTVLITSAKKSAEDTVSISAGGDFSMNTSLSAKMAGIPIQIRFSPDGFHFLITETQTDDPARLTFAKCGHKRFPEIAKLLSRKRITYPVKYMVWQTGSGCWQGDYIENPTMQLSAKQHNFKTN